MLTAFLFDTIGRYLRYRSQLASVYELDDRALLDIGLNRGELKATSWDLVHLARRNARERIVSTCATAQTQ